VYPYLLRGVPITRVNQVWSTDITSIRRHGGFVYLVAVMDWFSRYGLSWAVSITMEVGCCLEALEQALAVAIPDIFHSDQGAQFTSVEFTARLEAAVLVQCDGKRFCLLKSSLMPFGSGKFPAPTAASRGCPKRQRELLEW
jgi:putative transposase